MKTSKRSVYRLGLSIAGFLVLATNMAGSQVNDQTGTILNGTRPPNSSRNPLGADVNEPSPFPDTSAARRNTDRQKRLESDTQRLLALAAQLKTEVQSSGAQTMTPEMLRQMDEIEKLARSVKDKMRS